MSTFRLEDKEEALAKLTADNVIDCLRECFIVASAGISFCMEAGVADKFTEYVRLLGVKDGFGQRAMDILRAAGIEPPDVDALDKRHGGH